MVEVRSKFRVTRIPLEPRQIYAYYGLDASEAEEYDGLKRSTNDPNTPSKETENTSTIPSFNCSVPDSPFHSTYNESIATTNFGLNRTSAVSTQVPTPTLNVPQSPFCSTYYEDTNDLASQQERKSTETYYSTNAKAQSAMKRISTATSVVPSFQCDLAKSPFYSTYVESQTENAFSSQDPYTASQSTTMGDSQPSQGANTRKSFARSTTNRMSMLSTIPSFRCDLPDSPFYSSYEESQPQFGGSQDANSQKAPVQSQVMDAVSEEAICHEDGELLENRGEEVRNVEAYSESNDEQEEVEENVKRLLTNRFSTKFSNAKPVECGQPQKTVIHADVATNVECVTLEDSSSSQNANAVESAEVVEDTLEIDRNFGASRVSFNSAWKSLADVGNTLVGDSNDLSVRGMSNETDFVLDEAVSGKSLSVEKLSQKKESLASRNSVLDPSLREYTIEDPCDEQYVTRELSLMDYSIQKPAPTRTSTLYGSSLSIQEEPSKRSMTPVAPTISCILPKKAIGQSSLFKENGDLNEVQRRMTAHFMPSYQPANLIKESIQGGRTDLISEMLGESLMDYSIQKPRSARNSTIYESSSSTQNESSKRSMTPVVPTISCIVPKAATAQCSLFKENGDLNAVQRRVTAHFIPSFQPANLIKESIQGGRTDLFSEMLGESLMDYSIQKPRSARNSTIYESSSSTQNESSKRSMTPVVPTISCIVPKAATAQCSLFDENGDLNAVQRRVTAHFIPSFQPANLIKESIQGGRTDLISEMLEESLMDCGEEVSSPSTSFNHSIFTTGISDISNFNINSSSFHAGGNESGDVVDQSLPNDGDDSSVFDDGRRLSCATCGPNTDHIVMSGDVEPSPIYVLPAPKILHNNENSPSVEAGLRRSKRNRLPRLNVLQRPIYERDLEGNLNLVGATEAIVNDRMLKKYRVGDPIAAADKDHDMKKRKMLEREKKKLLRTRQQVDIE